MTDIGDQGPRSSLDAIPKDAIWLTEAYEYLAGYMTRRPYLLPGFPDGRWSEAVNKSSKVDLESNGGSVSDGGAISEEEIGEWLQRRRANLLMRKALTRFELIACVLHPRTGMVLQLHWQGWEADNWMDYIPNAIWSNFIFGDYISPGPSGTLLDGLLRPDFSFQKRIHRMALPQIR